MYPARRGDRTPLERFIAGARAWVVEICRRLAQESNACQPERPKLGDPGREMFGLQQ
jgi:hypothetical protein